ncbi:hypothetical protein MMC28_000332 [Mycoblastus sanguinarius]|nr:hypothetical protein [Mycoblastus sanguinarius]
MAGQEEIALSECGRGLSSGYEENIQRRIRNRSLQQEETGAENISLPNPDGGIDAWLFLAGCFCIEALTWGFPFSYGIFQEYYTTHPHFSEDASSVAIIGSSAMGIMYLGAPFTFALLQKFPYHRRYFSVIGLFIIVLALITSSFATRVWHLILTQGVMYAIGGSMLYTPTIVFLDEWFIRRKGFGFGVMWAGTGVSGVCIPFVMNWGLNKYSFSTMLRAWSIVLVVLSGPLLYYVKPRIPVSLSSHPRRLSFAFLKTSTFWILQTGNILESLGFFVPNIYLPTYARTLGLSSVAGTVTVSLFNTTSVFGQVILGSLIDRLHVTTVVLISTLGATLSVFLLWGLSASLPLLCIFSLVYGLFAGGFTSTYTGVIQELQKKDERAEAGLIFGLLAAGRGIGSVVTGPLSEVLLSERPWVNEAVAGYGSGYGGLIVFTGISAMLGGTSWIGRRIGWM